MVCFDERPCQLLADVRDPLPVARQGQRAARRPRVYERGGTANVHVAFETLAGWLRVQVTGRRRKQEFAEQVKRLAEKTTRRPRRRFAWC